MIINSKKIFTKGISFQILSEESYFGKSLIGYPKPMIRSGKQSLMLLLYLSISKSKKLLETTLLSTELEFKIYFDFRCINYWVLWLDITSIFRYDGIVFCLTRLQ